jgi:hypothetical protein
MIELPGKVVRHFSVRFSVTTAMSLHSIIVPLRLLAVFAAARRRIPKAKHEDCSLTHWSEITQSVD